MPRSWSKQSIAMEISRMYEAGESLRYSSVVGTSLLSAAIRHFGTWRSAIEFVGLDYQQIRCYKSWSRERIIARIQELHAQGVDLSWGNVCASVDPQLAAAATKKRYFGAWREALEAAGLDYDAIRRYMDWNDQRVVQTVRDFHANGTELNAKNMQHEDIRLLTAARRRFHSWPEALTVAGLDYRDVVQRAPFKRGKGRGQKYKVIIHSVE
jgi:hypothetical protein